MKIRSVTHNNRNKRFALRTSATALVFPYSQTDPVPTAQNPVRNIFVDDEAGREAFTYVLDSGASGTVHIEHVLEYNRDPRYLRDLLLYRLTIEAQKRASASPLSKREIVRRLGTSAPQLYRLLQVLNCDVDLVVRTKTAGSTAS